MTREKALQIYNRKSKNEENHRNVNLFLKINYRKWKNQVNRNKLITIKYNNLENKIKIL